MKILFIGPHLPYHNNSYLQYIALKKEYKNVDFIAAYKSFIFPIISYKIFHHISPKIFSPFINNYILTRIKKKEYDLIYVGAGELINKKLILELKNKAKKVVFFCNDNPFVSRDKNRWQLFLGAAKYYDVIAYHDKSRIKPSHKFGLRNSLLITPPYDKNKHCRQKLTKSEIAKYKNDVVFVGVWSRGKGIFLKKLMDLGLNFKIYGPRWENDQNYESLKHLIKPGYVLAKTYSKIIQSAKIAICLFADENLDTITTRSTEIPAIGTLMCSHRSDAMKKILIENKEAIYFKDPKECYKKCQYYLKNYKLAEKIAHSGHIKITKILKVSNNDFVKKIVNKAFNIK